MLPQTIEALDVTMIYNGYAFIRKIDNVILSSRTKFMRNILLEKETFTFSNIYPNSFSFPATFSHSFILIHSLSVTETMFFNASITSFTLSLSVSGSISTYVSMNYIFYQHTVVRYSSYISFYPDFFTIIFINEAQNGNLYSEGALNGIIVGSVAFVLLVSGIIIFLIHHNRREKSIISIRYKLKSNEETLKYEDIYNKKIREIAMKEDDPWI